jgi:hypothetical protein
VKEARKRLVNIAACCRRISTNRRIRGCEALWRFQFASKTAAHAAVKGGPGMGGFQGKGMRSVSLRGLIRSLYLRYLSQPAGDRVLYRAIEKAAVRSIVQIGVSLDSRTARLIEVATQDPTAAPLRYTGIDLFDARPADQPRLTLKHAFAALQSPAVRVQLVPGELATALHRVANSLTATDLLLICADQSRESLSAAWIWMPRMLTHTSLVFMEEPGPKPGQTNWRRLTLADVQRLASESGRPSRRAA